MSKKLYATCVPLLAVIAFVAVPAVANAAPQWQICKEVAKETGKYTTKACTTEKVHSNFEKDLVQNFASAVLVTGKNVGETSLTGELGGMTCTKIYTEDLLWNSRENGRGSELIEFSGCTSTGGLAKCIVTNPIIWEAATKLELEGTTNVNKYTPVSGEPFGDITLTGSECPLPGTLPWTGTTKGTFTGTSGKTQKFSGKTLSYLGKEAEFKGEIEQEGPKGASIFVN